MTFDKAISVASISNLGLIMRLHFLHCCPNSLTMIISPLVLDALYRYSVVVLQLVESQFLKRDRGGYKIIYHTFLETKVGFILEAEVGFI